ncbi:MAG: hypothetical protein HKP49_04660 [Maribacter sp.]|nr:hypothetical protein [Maribacter sp.]
MYHYLLKSLKIGLWIFLPLLFLSGAKGDQDFYMANFVAEKNELEATEPFEQLLGGEVYFENTLHTNKEGIPFATLSLKFVDDGLSEEHMMEFLITRKNQSSPIKKGKYGVEEDIDGFINDFDGVFGFANVKSLGEKPFFAKKGEVVITEITNLRLIGYLDVTLKCTNGTKILIKRGFNAAKKNG